MTEIRRIKVGAFNWICFFPFGDLAHPDVMIEEWEFKEKVKKLGYTKQEADE